MGLEYMIADIHISRHALRATLLLTLQVLTVGCDGVFYVLHAAQGQLAIQGATEPIDDVLASGRLSDEEAAKLRLLVDARDYAREVIGLNVGRSYSEYYDSGADPVVYSISASPRDALEPVVWWFPIFGEQENLMFFDEAYLRREEQKLIEQGYDTYVYEVDAYSTGGFLADPVRSPMLKRHTLSAVETIFHELLHNTIWRAGNSVFNESLATYVGRTAAAEFLVFRYGADSGWAEVAADYYSDLDTNNAFLLDLYQELTVYFAGSLSSTEKIAGREAVYQAARERFASEIQPALHYPTAFAGYANLPTNNAWMRLNYRYHLDLDLFDHVYRQVQRDWSAALDVFRSAARAETDPFEYLRQWLKERNP